MKALSAKKTLLYTKLQIKNYITASLLNENVIIIVLSFNSLLGKKLGVGKVRIQFQMITFRRTMFIGTRSYLQLRTREIGIYKILFKYLDMKSLKTSKILYAQ